MLIKCRAFFESNSHDQIGFYGPVGEPQRRIRNGDVFMFDYTDEKIEEREFTVFDVINGKEENHRKEKKKMIGRWIEVLEIPKKKKQKELLTSNGN